MGDPTAALDAILDAVVEGMPDGSGRVPGVVAMVTDRSGIVYAGARGEQLLGGDPMRTDTVFALYSTTKAITATAVLQCVEEGLVDLHAPASAYVPELADAKVLAGFDDDGDPVLRPPARPITTHMLLLHTAGFAYPMFNDDYRRMAVDLGRPTINRATMDALRYPLVAEPGERWEYGIGMDWAGLVVEAVRGQSLGDVVREHIGAPLGVDDLGFDPGRWPAARVAGIHARQPDGTLRRVGEGARAMPEVHMGGHGLYGTVDAYAAFIRMWLDDGDGPCGRVLAPETVALATRDGLEDSQRVRPLAGVMPLLSNDVDLLAGVRTSWAYAGMVNAERAAGGRSAGSVGWAGLANLFYWIDRKAGIGGFWATQVLPFGDPVSMRGFLDFEAAAYAGVAD